MYVGMCVRIYVYMSRYLYMHMYMHTPLHICMYMVRKDGLVALGDGAGFHLQLEAVCKQEKIQGYMTR